MPTAPVPVESHLQTHLRHSGILAEASSKRGWLRNASKKARRAMGWLGREKTVCSAGGYPEPKDSEHMAHRDSVALSCGHSVEELAGFWAAWNLLPPPSPHTLAPNPIASPFPSASFPSLPSSRHTSCSLMDVFPSLPRLTPRLPDLYLMCFVPSRVLYLHESFLNWIHTSLGTPIGALKNI